MSRPILLQHLEWSYQGGIRVALEMVQLSPYNPSVLDKSILWMNNADAGDSFTYVRIINNNDLNLDAFVTKAKGPTIDGTIVGLWQLNQGDNQKWQIVPH